MELPEYFTKLPPLYQAAVIELKKSIETTKSFAKINRILLEFVEKYTTIIDIWSYWERHTAYRHNYLKEIKKFSLQHFPMQNKTTWPSFDKLKCQIQRYSFMDDTNQEKIKSFLTLPHSSLNFAFDIYFSFMKHQKCPGLIEKYKTNCTIYKNIQSAAENNNIEEWIKALWETKSVQFVAKNIECRLANEPWNSQLWLNYIKFLEINDAETEYIFDVYSRYCRLFLEDKKMKEKYQNKVEEKSRSSFDGISKFWIDLVKFEFHFNTIQSASDLLKIGLAINEMTNPPEFYEFALDFVHIHGLTAFGHHKQKLIKESSRYQKALPLISLRRLMIQPNFEEVKVPFLPFRKPIARYILENVNVVHMQKLQQTCKFFFIKFPYLFAYRLTFHGKQENLRRGYTYNFAPTQNNWNCLKNVWLLNTLEIHMPILPQFYSNIYKNDLRSLTICHSISYNEFKILTEAPIKKFVMHTVCFRENGEEVAGQDMLKLIPYANIIHYQRCAVTQETAAALIQTAFKNKIDDLDIGFSREIDVNALCIFLQNNLASNASIDFEILSQLGGDYMDEFEDRINELINHWTPSTEKPFISWRHRKQDPDKAYRFPLA